jgi:hypothetical protein
MCYKERVITALLLFATLGSFGFFAFLLLHEIFSKLQTATRITVRVGDRLIYRMQKVSTRPSPRAYEVYPASEGDTYRYFVDKYWTVKSVGRDGDFSIVTRTGKLRRLQPEDPNYRRAGLITRVRYAKRFPRLLEMA